MAVTGKAAGIKRESAVDERKEIE
jgi:hypothetical protein